jgi:hypothetical protein
MGVRIFSFGGGVQSTAALVLAAEGKIDFPLFAFANVGADSEDPLTIEYIERHAKPYAAAHGIDLREVRKVRRDGQELTLMQHLEQQKRSVPIPVRMSNGAPGRRSCTQDFKIVPIAKLAKALGATPADPAVIGLGISIDEFQRMSSTNHIAYTVREYPLIDLRLDRSNCMSIIERAGLPIPPKSSCFFCPFHTRGAWQRLRQDRPALFDKSVALETMLNERRDAHGQTRVFLHSSSLPLLQATSPHRQDGIFDEQEDSCESGYCMV